MQRFANANLLAKYAAPAQVAQAIEVAKKGPLYPRDYLTAAMLSGLYTFQKPDGTVIFPMSLVTEVSSDLDIIAQVPGSLLVRGDKIWQPLGPLTDGQIIIGQSGSAVPVVKDWPIEFTGLRISDITKYVESTSAYATKGWFSTTLVDTWIDAIVPYYTAVAGATYRGTLATMNGTTINSIITQTSSITPSASAVRRDYMKLSSLVKINAGTQLGVFWTRTDSTGSTHPGIWRSNVKVQLDFPHSADLAWFRLASNNPSVGQIGQSNTTVDLFSVDLAYTFKG